MVQGGCLPREALLKSFSSETKARSCSSPQPAAGRHRASPARTTKSFTAALPGGMFF